MRETLKLYQRFAEETGDPVAASNLTLAHAMLQQHVQRREQTLTAAEAAKRLKIGKKKLYRLCQKGEIPHHRIGDRIRIRIEDLDELSQPPKEPVRRPRRRQTTWV